MDTTLCNSSLVLACQIDDILIGKFEDVHGRLTIDAILDGPVLEVRQDSPFPSPPHLPGGCIRPPHLPPQRIHQRPGVLHIVHSFVQGITKLLF